MSQGDYPVAEKVLFATREVILSSRVRRGGKDLLFSIWDSGMESRFFGPPRREPQTDIRPDFFSNLLWLLGGAKGGRVWARKLTKEHRFEAASKAAKVRWRKHRKKRDD